MRCTIPRPSPAPSIPSPKHPVLPSGTTGTVSYTHLDELSYYLSQGLAIRVYGITISDANLEHLNLILNEDDSYMKEYVNDQEGEIYAIEYQKIKE